MLKHPNMKKAVCLLTLAVPLWAQASTKACRIPNFPQEVQCGQVSRPLDPSQPDGKKIDVHYVVLPSQDRNKLPDAVFLLAGGPGQSAIGVSAFGESMLGKLNRRRDLVFVDQRGTGKSAPLKCPKLENDETPMDQAAVVKRVLECKDDLQKLPHGDLRFYTTSIAVQDLEAVRAAQNYSAINLVGVSYGTRVGLEYLRQFPKSVRRLVIDGVVPPDLNLLGTDAKAALDGIFADCKADTRCNTAYPDLENRWKHLLSGGTRQATFTHPRLGTEVSMPISREDIIGMVFRGLYSPTVTSVLPYAIAQADQGKFGPLANLGGGFNLPSPTAMSMGMHYSVWCSEAYVKPPAANVNDELSSVMANNYGKICSAWPRGDVPAEFFTIPKSNSPVLLLSGGIDPVTPTRNGDQVAKALGEKARHLFIKNAGHGLIGQGCVREVVNNFVAAKDDQEAAKVDASCVVQIPRPLVWVAPKAASSVKSNRNGEQQ
ncbi:alpha/beta hydrolase [Undibacterium sp. LX40W]|uniref:Alpha/beta hydrolase n=1 Tax=Undibacterium nitidum TaxID=2762298 RepID=A0A923KKP7_9BURK|nr:MULTISPECIES: alpha/beta hydrolase [Undibacterium]MBC3881010.1 alpha/beta hydrolase [Undibacterium nitidum]MBC3890257.1 alpha/beta hydrolase [Undibacterium sp. LX40W]